jgi:hypothetical protein
MKIRAMVYKVEEIFQVVKKQLYIYIYLITKEKESKCFMHLSKLLMWGPIGLNHKCKTCVLTNTLKNCTIPTYYVDTLYYIIYKKQNNEYPILLDMFQHHISLMFFTHSYNNPSLQNLDSLHSCFQRLGAQSKIVIHLQQNKTKETIVLMANVNWKTLVTFTLIRRPMVCILYPTHK